jgi:hypothetical protein
MSKAGVSLHPSAVICNFKLYAVPRVMVGQDCFFTLYFIHVVLDPDRMWSVLIALYLPKGELGGQREL